MLIMRETKAIVEKVDQKTKERTGETGVLMIFEPGEASYCADGSSKRISIPIEELPNHWKVGEIKELKVDSEKGLYKLLHLDTSDWMV